MLRFSSRASATDSPIEAPLLETHTNLCEQLQTSIDNNSSVPPMMTAPAMTVTSQRRPDGPQVRGILGRRPRSLYGGKVPTWSMRKYHILCKDDLIYGGMMYLPWLSTRRQMNPH